MEWLHNGVDSPVLFLTVILCPVFPQPVSNGTTELGRGISPPTHLRNPYLLNMTIKEPAILYRRSAPGALRFRNEIDIVFVALTPVAISKRDI